MPDLGTPSSHGFGWFLASIRITPYVVAKVSPKLLMLEDK
jgi:hypothetical protein